MASAQQRAGFATNAGVCLENRAIGALASSFEELLPKSDALRRGSPRVDQAAAQRVSLLGEERKASRREHTSPSQEPLFSLQALVENAPPNHGEVMSRGPCQRKGIRSKRD